MDILNEVVTGRTRQTRHLYVASSPGGVEGSNLQYGYERSSYDLHERYDLTMVS